MKVFKQERRFWDHGGRIYLVLHQADSPEMAAVLQKVYGMTRDEDLQTLWVSMAFREELASFPQVFGSNEAVKRFVSRVTNAVGFIDASVANGSVKILRIDGKLPGESGYLLTSQASGSR